MNIIYIFCYFKQVLWEYFSGKLYPSEIYIYKFSNILFQRGWLQCTRALSTSNKKWGGDILRSDNIIDVPLIKWNTMTKYFIPGQKIYIYICLYVFSPGLHHEHNNINRASVVSYHLVIPLSFREKKNPAIFNISVLSIPI